MLFGLLQCVVVWFWFTVDEPLQDTSPWVKPPAPRDYRAIALLERLHEVPKRLDGIGSYLQLSATRRALSASCSSDMATCFRMTLSHPDIAEPLVPDNPEYWRLHQEILSGTVGQLVDGGKIAPVQAIISTARYTLMRDLIDHGQIDAGKFVAHLRNNRRLFKESNLLITKMVFTASLGMRLSYLGELLAYSGTRSPEMVELDGFEEVLAPMKIEQLSYRGAFQQESSIAYRTLGAQETQQPPWFKTNVYVNRHIKLYEHYSSFSELSDENFWKQDPTFPGYTLAEKIIDPLGTWGLAVLGFRDIMTVIRATNLTLAVALARQRIYQGASPENHGVAAIANWQWQWKPGFSELCLVPVTVHAAHEFTFPFCSRIAVIKPTGPTSPVLPEMVEIPGGEFVMGDHTGQKETELPLHRVRLEAFQLGKYEVTKGEYNRFARATGRRFIRTKESDSQPAINVSLEDARAYAEWLSKETGTNYRLPSEAEWEYAARAGSESLYSHGDPTEELCLYANHRTAAEHYRRKDDGSSDTWTTRSGCENNVDNQTAEVGQFQANAFGLHDMHGNVAEWVADVWHANYEQAPEDGSVWLNVKCHCPVSRGGSYRSGAGSVRSSSRSVALATFSIEKDIGFRIAARAKQQPLIVP